MTFANDMDRDQAPLNVGPDLPSILFDAQHQYLLKTGCIAWNDLNSEDIEIYQFYKLFKNFMTAFYQKPLYLG